MKKPVSYGYSLINKKEASRFSRAWLKKELPGRQMEVVGPLLTESKIPDIATPVIKILKQIRGDNITILDVGCSSGYYLDFFRLAGLKVKYEGCDISPSFIKLAKSLHPETKFKVADLTSLPYKDLQFPVVLVSGTLHCSLNYKKALKEVSRVSSQHIILHRLPVFQRKTSTKYFTKIGYGVKMMEVVFGKEEINYLFKKNNLVLEKILKDGQVDINKLKVGKAYWTTFLLQKLVA